MPESEDLPVYNARDSSPEPGVCNAAAMQLPPAGTIQIMWIVRYYVCSQDGDRSITSLTF